MCKPSFLETAGRDMKDRNVNGKHAAAECARDSWGYGKVLRDKHTIRAKG